MARAPKGWNHVVLVRPEDWETLAEMSAQAGMGKPDASTYATGVLCMAVKEYRDRKARDKQEASA